VAIAASTSAALRTAFMPRLAMTSPCPLRQCRHYRFKGPAGQSKSG
jgi:hypothetical protein